MEGGQFPVPVHLCSGVLPVLAEIPFRPVVEAQVVSVVLAVVVLEEVEQGAHGKKKNPVLNRIFMWLVYLVFLLR